jgi:hypothetical protein
MAPGFFGLFSSATVQRRYARQALQTILVRVQSHLQAFHPPRRETSPSIADNSEKLEDSQLSLETDYVLADVDSPPIPSTSSYPLASSSSTSGASSSTTKIKMPFRRKQSTSSKFSTTTAQSSLPPVPPQKSPTSSLSTLRYLTHPPYVRLPRALLSSVLMRTHTMPYLPVLSPRMRHSHTSRDSTDTARIYETMSNPDFICRPISSATAQAVQQGRTIRMGTASRTH